MLYLCLHLLHWALPAPHERRLDREGGYECTLEYYSIMCSKEKRFISSLNTDYILNAEQIQAASEDNCHARHRI